MNEKQARAIVAERAGGDLAIRDKGWCEARTPWCEGRATEYQHRKAKKHCTPVELWAPSNGLMVCGLGNVHGCHGYIHQNPTTAYSYGWSCRQSLDPARMPVYRLGVWVHIDAYGGVTPIEDIVLVALSQELGFGIEGAA